MKPNRVRLPQNSLFPDGASKPDLDALKTAKARQDVSHQKLDKWIAAAIAELSDEKRRRPARGATTGSGVTRRLSRPTQPHSAASSAPAPITSSTFGGDIGKL
jgi:hypothetical protein